MRECMDDECLASGTVVAGVGEHCLGAAFTTAIRRYASDPGVARAEGKRAAAASGGLEGATEAFAEVLTDMVSGRSRVFSKPQPPEP